MTINNNSFDALPIEVVNSAMTESQLRVMNVLFAYNSLDKTAENGSFFITNDEIMSQGKIGSRKTLNNVLSNFKTNRFIDRKSGSIVNHQASEYILNVDEVIRWSIEHPCKNELRYNTHNTDIMQMEKIVVNAITPILTHQQELLKFIERLRDEIDELKSCLISQSTCTPMGVRCTTDTDTDSDTQYKKINNSTDSTVIRNQADRVTPPDTEVNRYDDKLSQLKQSVEKFKEIPTRAMKKAISNIVADIKSLHQQGGCTDKQLNLAYFIQSQINDIPFKEEPSLSASNDGDSSSIDTVQNEYINTSVPHQCNKVVHLFNPFQPSETDDKELLRLIHSKGRFYNQALCDDLLDRLRHYDTTVIRKYIDAYLSYACRDEYTVSIYKDNLYEKIASLKQEL